MLVAGMEVVKSKISASVTLTKAILLAGMGLDVNVQNDGQDDHQNDHQHGSQKQHKMSSG